jgi:predicted membrane chloride channel (bestrophin family)
VIIFIFPLLFVSFVTKLWFACVLNFLTVLCFLGLNEVSRELDNPFQNIPNDIPVTTYQAQMNEALVTLYAGFHPDSWWEISDTDALNFKAAPNAYI